MIFCHLKTQLLTTLPTWQGGPLAALRFFPKKRKRKVKRKVDTWVKVVRSCVLGWQCIISLSGIMFKISSVSL
jgi:hypothetical protein